MGQPFPQKLLLLSTQRARIFAPPHRLLLEVEFEKRISHQQRFALGNDLATEERRRGPQIHHVDPTIDDRLELRADCCQIHQVDGLDAEERNVDIAGRSAIPACARAEKIGHANRRLGVDDPK